MTLTSATQRAPLVTLVNVRSGETLEMQFNPQGLEEKIGANYARQTVPGLSHQVMQFVNTKNITYRTELFFESANSGPSGQARILDARRYLMSVCHPRQAGGAIRTAGAPRLMLVWPGFFSVTCVLIDVTFRYNRMNVANVPCAFIAQTNLENIRDVMVTSEEFRLRGTDAGQGVGGRGGEGAT